VDGILIAAPGGGRSSLVERSLRTAGHATTLAADPTTAIGLVRDKTFDLFVLDLEHSARGWDSALRRLRAADPRVPVIVIAPSTARDEDVAALAREADECVTRPFGIEELLARVRSRLRERTAPRRRFLRAGEIALDLETHRVEVRGRPVELSDRELALLETMMRHPDEVLSREQLLASVWGYDFDPGSNVVAVYVRYLRNKLGPDTVETVRGAGYRLRD
jgi:DNA-binding response OmpR family regulator